MNRYFGIIFVVLLGAVVFAVGTMLIKEGVFKDILSVAKILKPVLIFKNIPSNTPSQNNEQKENKKLGNSEPYYANFEPPTGFRKDQLSPYYRKISMSSAERNSFSGIGVVSGITLQSNYGLKEKINITSWKVKSNKNTEIEIPRAVNNADLRNLWAESDIILGQGERVLISTVSNPLGKNLQLNKCAGYLNNFYKFSPELPNNCPGVQRNEIISFSGGCQNVITALGTCKTPNEKDLNSPAVLNDPACRAYLDKLNYGGCYSRYSSDLDFLSKEWRVWLRQGIPFDAEHDRLLLYDGQGLLVDEHLY